MHKKAVNLQNIFQIGVRKKQNKIINNKNQRSKQVKLTLEIKCVTHIQGQIDLCYFITSNLDNRQDCVICRECKSVYKAKVEGKKKLKQVGTVQCSKYILHGDKILKQRYILPWERHIPGK